MRGPWNYHLDGVRQIYAGRIVLDIEHMEVPPGGTLCLLGPTGAGKSTLLKLLAGLEAPHQGSILLGGRHRTDRLPLEVRRRVTLVFQRPLLFATTVRENVERPLHWRGAPGTTERARALLEKLGLAQRSRQRARSLSGGETQLVALARALVLEPDVLLLDEPTAHLDPPRVALVEQVVREYQKGRGATLVWATHNLFQARRVADQVAFLLEGKRVEQGPAERVFTEPEDPRTRAFVKGEMIY